MRRTAGQVAAIALTAGMVAAAPLPAVASASATPAISIAATSSLKPVTGYIWVLYQSGKFSNATVHGTVTGAASGEVARLYARMFPYSSAASVVGSVTLRTAGTTAKYAFKVTPGLATRYEVKLFAKSSSTTPLAASATATIYVVGSARPVKYQRCRRPVCREALILRFFVPQSTLQTEEQKKWDAYFGLRLSRTQVPPPPSRLLRGGGNARVSRSRLTFGGFTLTIIFSFRIGNDGYRWLWNACSRDTEAKDGLNLPGHHGCGSKVISAKTPYLG